VDCGSEGAPAVRRDSVPRSCVICDREEGDLSEGGNGEASVEERQRARDKGKAKVQDSWCVELFEKAESSRRKKEERDKDEQLLREAQELRRRDQLTEEQGRRFEQRERALISKKKIRRKEEKRISEV
jgi:hypothetical protein